MTALLILARVLHIVSAIFWGGTILFVNFLLGPAAAATGPEGGRVMGELMRRRYFEWVLGAATLTILSGFYLIWVDSTGFTASWFGTGMGRGISTGMLAALIAYIMGIFVVHPTLVRMLALGGQAGQASGGEREALMAEMVATRSRLIRRGGVAMSFLMVAMLAMAVARYL